VKFKVGRLMKAKMQEIAKAHAARDGQVPPPTTPAPAKA